MSTVLWANLWVDGAVEGESEDRAALYAQAKALDALTRKLGLPSFLALCDTTDVRFNLDEFGLPEGMTSTDPVMARDGVIAFAKAAEGRAQKFNFSIVT